MATHKKSRRATKTAASKKQGKARPGQVQRRRTPRKGKRWSQRVTEDSDALDLERGVFTLSRPREIAASLKRSALRSRRRKSSAYRSALSMLTFYMNRAGRNLSAERRRTLNAAKDQLRQLFGHSTGKSVDGNI
jgi:hypothetical protein